MTTVASKTDYSHGVVQHTQLSLLVSTAHHQLRISHSNHLSDGITYPRVTLIFRVESSHPTARQYFSFRAYKLQYYGVFAHRTFALSHRNCEPPLIFYPLDAC